MINGKPVLFDLFCGGGLAARGYRRAGFYVVGFDIEPQKEYQGDESYRIDALDLLPHHLDQADAIHASPCCQFASLITPDKSKHENFIPFTRDLLTRTRKPYVIENVENARFWLNSPVVLCGAHFGLKVYRHRLFETNFDVFQPEHSPHRDTASRKSAYKSGGTRHTGVRGMTDKGFVTVTGNCNDVAYCRSAMGVDWEVTRAKLVQGIPPVYAEFLGLHLMAHLTGDVSLIHRSHGLLCVPNSLPMFVAL